MFIYILFDACASEMGKKIIARVTKQYYQLSVIVAKFLHLVSC